MSTECPICLDVIESKDSCTTECGHVFHSACAFRAVCLDRRCSICRHPLVPERQQQPVPERHIRIEVNGMEFGELSDQIRRTRRNYQARRRRLETHDALLGAMRARWKDAEAELTQSSRRYELQYGEGMRRVDAQLSVRNERHSRDRCARRERTLRNQYESHLQDILGEPPPLNIDQVLVEHFGDALDGAFSDVLPP